MLFGFLGSPCSGKTTTAAKAFAELKDSGQPTEYIAERARMYIAEKRFKRPDEELVLNDFDQIRIASDQHYTETVMNNPNTIVITDSCVLNSLLYMTPEFRDSPDVKELAKQAAGQYDIIFVSSPVPRPLTTDMNRVHDEVTSLEIHNLITTVLGPYLEGKKVMYLHGTPYSRMNQVLSAVLQEFIGRP